MEKINIAEILKSCPKGMELDCTSYDNVSFDKISDDKKATYPIFCYITDKEGNRSGISFTENGCESKRYGAKCVIFPKGKTTWEGFVPPCQFEDGDIVTSRNGDYIFMLKKAHIYKDDDAYKVYNGTCYFGLVVNAKSLITKENKWYFNRLATEEEKAELFQAVKDNGYRWDEETKTLEKLITPNFKVWDVIRRKNRHEVRLVSEVCDNYYLLDEKDIPLSFFAQDDWELVPNKFDITTLKPFESKVLVRQAKTDVWQPAFYGFFHQPYKRFYTTSSTWLMCIPYNEDTKHLTGTTNDCDDFYKTWK